MESAAVSGRAAEHQRSGLTSGTTRLVVAAWGEVASGTQETSPASILITKARGTPEYRSWAQVRLVRVARALASGLVLLCWSKRPA
jgi:hypothetical protein